MSEHKTGSAWTPDQKKLYRERKEKGLSGTPEAVTVFRRVKDEQGNDQLQPIGNKVGGRDGTNRRALRRDFTRKKLREQRQQQRLQAHNNGRGQ